MHGVCGNGTCLNQPGSFVCDCKEGFESSIMMQVCMGKLKYKVYFLLNYHKMHTMTYTVFYLTSFVLYDLPHIILSAKLYKCNLALGHDERRSVIHQSHFLRQ